MKQIPTYEIGTPGSHIDRSLFTSLGSLDDIVSTLLTFAITMSGLVALIYFIQGGYMYITSQGEQGQTKKAKDTMLWAGAGLIAVLSSVLFARFVTSELLGSNII